MGGMRPVLLALTLAASGCGGAVATPPGSDGGSTQTPSPSASGTTETALGTGYETGTVANSTTAISVEPNTGTAPSTSTGTALATGTSSASCMIEATDYDQSCAQDADCRLVTAGNYCAAGCLCPNEAINVADAVAFKEAVDQALSVMNVLECSSCPPRIHPCCRQGLCTLDCVSGADTLSACADAGGACFYEVSCTPPLAPTNSCVYSDETCCPLPAPSPP